MLLVLFGPEYISADSRQVSARAALGLHTLLHGRLEAATAMATSTMAFPDEQVDARITQLQEQLTILEFQKKDTENALDQARNMCTSIQISLKYANSTIPNQAIDNHSRLSLVSTFSSSDLRD
jgi:hypothetical protein